MAEFLSRTYSRLGNAKSILSKAIHVGKLYSGQYPVLQVKTALKPLVDSVCETIQPLAASKQITLQVDVSDIDVETDPDILHSIVLNLLSNAIKYTDPHGKVTIQITARDNHTLGIMVQDNGRGIPQDQQQSIFQPYHQVQESDRSQGSGLGLAFVKKYVELLHGEITLESEIDKGSVFTITLPMSTGHV
jgi:signal transduction histidine kinase